MLSYMLAVFYKCTSCPPHVTYNIHESLFSSVPQFAHLNSPQFCLILLCMWKVFHKEHINIDIFDKFRVLNAEMPTPYNAECRFAESKHGFCRPCLTCTLEGRLLFLSSFP